MPPDYTDLASDDEIEEMVCSECGETIRDCVCDEEPCWQCEGRGWIDLGYPNIITCPECGSP